MPLNFLDDSDRRKVIKLEPTVSPLSDSNLSGLALFMLLIK